MAVLAALVLGGSWWGGRRSAVGALAAGDRKTGCTKRHRRNRKRARSPSRAAEEASTVVLQHRGRSNSQHQCPAPLPVPPSPPAAPPGSPQRPSQAKCHRICSCDFWSYNPREMMAHVCFRCQRVMAVSDGVRLVHPKPRGKVGSGVGSQGAVTAERFGQGNPFTLLISDISARA